MKNTHKKTLISGSPSKSLLRLTIASSVIIGCATSAFADYIGPRDWSKVRLYGHNNNTRTEYTQQEFNYIKNNFYYNTIEKSHNGGTYGGDSILASEVAAARIVKDRPASRPLVYWNAYIAYNDFYKGVQAMLSARKTQWFTALNSAWVRPYAFKLADNVSRYWWAKYPSDSVSRSKHFGTFVDGVGLASTRGNLWNTRQGIKQIKGFKVYNGYFVNDEASGVKVHAGPEMIHEVNGVFVEYFVSSRTDTPDEAAKQMEILYNLPADKHLFVVGWPGNELRSDGKTDHKFTLAAYLIIANDLSFYSFMDKGWHAVFKGSKTVIDPNDGLSHPDFSRRLGAPKGKAKKWNKYTYTRSFQYADVFIDLSKGISNIRWK